ncbi:TonB-dependent receptor [Sulfidibacter corallicola]|uniref:TonB-dependent receptor n=1 Tax=Sulfidibacter corallicola TaxID=2818388 RepID=A0A8A4TKY4_SULCO|nr:TonB-dependent receptor [Sulfidibacter corallicola]QTD49864.1 TonB-dependent receptor [Sulfidibacter corallicola]
MRNRLRRRGIAILLMWTMGFLHPVALASVPPPPPYLGMKLSEALRDLRGRGLNIIYSSRLVRDEMRVKAEPKATSPRDILVELLAQHRLRVVPGPDDSLLVVRDTRPTSARIDLRGVVVGIDTRKPLAGARIGVAGTDLQADTDELGRFTLTVPDSQSRSLTIALDGYLPYSVAVTPEPDAAPTVFELIPFPVLLEEMVVMPSAYRLLRQEGAPEPLLSNEEINRLPRISDDLYRALGRLPGTAGGDISANFSIRGGEENEVLVVLDGLEIYEPFHLKDLQSIFSIFDSKAIGGVNFLSGGFPAKYGTRMSGVIEMATLEPDERWTTELGVSFLHARLLSSDKFAKGRARWLVSLREGFLDLFRAVESPDSLTNQAEEEFMFSDGQFKFQFSPNDRWHFALNGLGMEDAIRFTEGGLLGSDHLDEDESVALKYQDRYLWLQAEVQATERLNVATLVSTGSIHRDRQGHQLDGLESIFEVRDLRDFDFTGIKQQFEYAIGDRHFLQWGWGVKRFTASYDYASRVYETSPLVVGSGPPMERWTTVALEPEGNQHHAFVSHRMKLWEPVTAEFGLRWDQQTYVPGDPSQVSPRFNLTANLGPGTKMRLGWGHYHQVQGIYELQVEDGIDAFQDEQRAEHRVISLEHAFWRGWFLKLEAYQKLFVDPHFRFENRFNSVALFPESEPDRIRIAPESGEARGIEFFLKSNPQHVLSAWMGYATGRAEDRIDGEYVPRNRDQRHAIQLGFNFRPSRSWSLNVAGSYHSGWPTTQLRAVAERDANGEMRAVPVYGPHNGIRLPSYRRIDLRVTHERPARGGAWTFFLETTNARNRKNVCCLEHEFTVDEQGEVKVRTEEDHWLPLIPSLGVTRRF